LSSLSEPTVLIVDDNRTMRAILDDILQSHHYRTLHATNGVEALKVVKEHTPSLVLLDLVMPHMDGIKFCRAVRGFKDTPWFPIIVVSSRDDKKTIANALAEGADDFITKPVDEVELLARVKAHLRLRSLYETLERDKRDLETILDIGRAVSATLDSSEILYIIVKKVAEITNADRCSIVLIGKGNTGYVLASHEDPTLKDLRIDLRRYPEIKEVSNTKKAVIIDDLAEDPRMEKVRKLVSSLKGVSMLVVPIVWREKVLGTILLRSRRKGNKFTDHEVALCQIIANFSSHPLRNARIFEEVSKERDRFKDLAITDQLTNTYNHTFFYNRLDDEFSRAIRYNLPLSLIMLDIDGFKRVNDTYGHRKGDKVLRELATVVKKTIRKTDLLARYGGEEFAVLLPNTSLQGAMEEAERIREKVYSHNYETIAKEVITVSLGVASFPHKMINLPGDLVSLADRALYESKGLGKNRVVTIQDSK